MAKGYDPNDTEQRRLEKACCFVKSMKRKGQTHDDAVRIASGYYHVKDTDVKAMLEDDELDDDVYFLVNGAIPVSASELMDDGDFC